MCAHTNAHIHRHTRPHTLMLVIEGGTKDTENIEKEKFVPQYQKIYMKWSISLKIQITKINQ